MIPNKSIDVIFHDISFDGSGFADVFFHESKSQVRNIRIKRNEYHALRIYLPYGFNWNIKELSWPETRHLIISEYNKNIKIVVPDINFKDFDDNNNCKADLTFSDSGIAVNDITITRDANEWVTIRMPDWMQGQWSFPDILWSDIRRLVYKKYLSIIGKTNQKGIEKRIGADSFWFYSYKKMNKVATKVSFATPNVTIYNILVIYNTLDLQDVKIYLPKNTLKNTSINAIDRKGLVKVIKDAYRYQILGFDDVSEDENVTVEFQTFTPEDSCMVDVKLGHNSDKMIGFKINVNDKGYYTVIKPHWIGQWDDPIICWKDLCKQIYEAFTLFCDDRDNNSNNVILDSLNNSSEKSNFQKRIEGHSNAEELLSGVINDYSNESFYADTTKSLELVKKSPFRFHPHTVLRMDAKEFEQKRGVYALVEALNKGIHGGIGPFEIGILKWINYFRYATKLMIVELIHAGFLSYGWRKQVNNDVLGRSIDRMCEYNLIKLTRFASVDDDGKIERFFTNSKIITMGQNGNLLLHELGIKTSPNNLFDIYRDGNTVKKYLVANQWIIYWLKNHKSEIGPNYDTSFLIEMKGITRTKARVYGMVTANINTFVAEPIRRVEDFERSEEKKSMIGKINRFIDIFDHLNQIFCEDDELNLIKRPILTLICEDEDHALETWRDIKPILIEKGRQLIWFTDDVKLIKKETKDTCFYSFTKDENTQIIEIKNFIYGR